MYRVFRKRYKNIIKTVVFTIVLQLAFSPLLNSISYFNNQVVHIAEAAFNSQINYQGKLTTSTGIAVNDGTYNIEFKLYTSPSGGSPIWTETWCKGSSCSGSGTDNRIQITSGLFSTMLGSTTAFNGVDFNQVLYLGVNIGGSGNTPSWDGEMTPRKKLGAVPAALISDTVDGISSEQFLRSDAVNATSTATAFLTINQTGAGDILNLHGQSSVRVFTVKSDGKIGIGTTTPGQMLSVAGDILGNNIIGSYFTATSTSVTNTFPLLTATTATTTNLAVTGITSSLLKTNSLGQLTAAVAGTDYTTFGYLFPSNATSTLLSLNGGLTSYASTTIGNNTQTGGLTISGGATTTGNAYFAGSIGVGTASPTYKLDVFGGTTRLQVDGSGTQIPLYIANNQTAATDLGSRIGFLGQGSANMAAIDSSWNAAATTDSYLRFFTRGSGTLSERVRITSDGNVGIGTTSPASVLPNSWNSNANSKMLTIVSQDTATDAGIFLRRSDGSTGLDLWSDSNTGDVFIDTRWGGATRGIQFRTNTASSPLSAMTILGNGYVGIGTTSPISKLAVVGSAESSIPIAGVSGNQFNITAAGLYGLTQGVLGTGNVYSQVQRFDGTATTYSYLLQPNGGNVGIGTTSPYAKLSVGGNIVGTNITATGTLSVAGASTLASVTATSLTLGSLNGPLQANNGVVSATSSVGVLYGGTGLSSAPSYGQLLLGNSSGGYTLTATSSLGFLTTDVAEGTNLYYTSQRVIDLIHASTTIPKTYTDNTFTGTNNFNILTANNGTITYASTTAISSGNAWFSGNVGIGTTSPGHKLEVAGNIGVNQNAGNQLVQWYQHDAKNRFAFYVQGDGSFWGLSRYNDSGAYTAEAIRVLRSNGYVGIGGAFTPASQLSVNGGTTIGSSYTSITAPTDGLLVEGNVGIGTTSPYAKLSVGGNIVGTNITATGTLSVAGASTLASVTATSLTLGSLNGPLQANNGVVSATSSVGVLYGGTGLSSAPSYGQLLLGNSSGGYTLTATSSLGLAYATQIGSGTSGQVPFYASTGTDLTATSSLFIAANGNVGLGTTSPGKKLNIQNSGLLISGGSTIDSSPYTARLIVDSEASFAHTLAEFKNVNGTVLTVTGSNIIAPYASTTALTVAGNAYFPGSGIWSSSGNVGIGTISTTYRFEVLGSGSDIVSGSMRTRNTSDNSAAASIMTVVSGTSDSASGYLGAFHGSYSNSAVQNRVIVASNSDATGVSLYAGGTGQDIRFHSGSSAVRMTIDTNGRVGIGTTTPDTSLSVLSTTPTLKLGNSTTALVDGDTLGTLEFLNNDASTGAYGTGALIRAVINDDSAGGAVQGSVSEGTDLIFQTGLVGIVSTPQTLTERMRINKNGKIGIGTTTPGQMLSVAGDILGNNIIGSYFTATSTSVTNTFPLLTATTATTTNLAVTGITSSLLKTNSLGQLTAAVAGTDYTTFGYLFPSNATSTLLSLNGGLTSYASTTIGNNTQTGGLTISGGATTTGNAYFAGSIGVGTTSPEAPLTINHTGTGYIAKFRRSAGVGSLAINIDNYLGTATRDVLLESLPDTSSNTAGFLFRTKSGGTTYDALSITGAGRVGIGTTTPQSELEVAGSTIGTLTISSKNVTVNQDDIANQISFWGSDASLNGSGQQAAIKTVGDNAFGSAYALSFWTGVPNAITEKMRISQGGNVGIGTTSPTQKLTVGGGNILLDNNYGLRIKDASGVDRSVVVYGTSNNVQLNNSASTGHIQLVNSNDIGSIILYTGSGSVEGFRLNAVGNVGIGTTSPYAKLSVGGNIVGTNITATGTLSVAGASTLASVTATSLTLGSLNGPLQANNGVVSATSSVGVLYGGTGLSSAPSYGQLLLGNSSGGYTITATSSLGLGNNTFLGLSDTQSSFNANRILYTNSSATALTDDSGFTFNGTTLTTPSVTSSSLTLTNTFPLLTATTATTTNLAVTGITSSLLKTNSLGQLTAAVAGTDYTTFGYLFPSNATSTLLSLNGGLTSYASTTIGNNTQTGGLTISGGATTTGNAYIAGSLSVATNNFILGTDGNLGIGTTSPVSVLPNLWNSNSSSRALAIVSQTTSTDAGIFLRRSDSATGLDLWSDNSAGDVYIDNRWNGAGRGTHFRVGTNTTPVTAMTILANTALVGIGTTTPQARLHVSGGTNGSNLNILRLENTTGVTAGTGASVEFYQRDSAATHFEGAKIGTVLINGGSGTATTDLVFNVYGVGSSTEAFRMTGDGFFERRSQTNPNAFYLSNPSTAIVAGDTVGTIGFHTDDGSTIPNRIVASMKAIAEGTYVGTDAAATALTFSTHPNGSGEAERMRITATGSVGIGTTSPGRLFSVAGDILGNNIIGSYFTATSSATSTFNFIDVNGTGSNATSTIASNLWVKGNLRASVSYVGDLVFSNNFRFVEAPDGSVPQVLYLQNQNGSKMLAINEYGNMGLGTSTPEYKLHVMGDVAATSFVNISTKNSKKDIEYLQDQVKVNILNKIKNLKVAEYHYKSENSNDPLRIGLIAEEAPEEILSVGGKGIDIYKLSTFTLVGIQEQQKQIESIDSRVLALEDSISKILASQSNSLSSISTVTSASIISYLESLGASISDGIARFKNLIADTFTVGSREKPSGITLFDEETGEPYCLKIRNGQTVTTPGECTLVKVTNNPPTQSTSSTSGTTTNNNNPPVENNDSNIQENVNENNNNISTTTEATPQPEVESNEESTSVDTTEENASVEAPSENNQTVENNSAGNEVNNSTAVVENSNSDTSNQNTSSQDSSVNSPAPESPAQSQASSSSNSSSEGTSGSAEGQSSGGSASGE